MIPGEPVKIMVCGDRTWTWCLSTGGAAVRAPGCPIGSERGGLSGKWVCGMEWRGWGVVVCAGGSGKTTFVSTYVNKTPPTAVR
jgi:hypothetical protein